MKITTKACLAAIAACGALHIGRMLVRSRRMFEWRGARVVIVGGSRGLGLVLARQLAAQGARLAICARDSNDLEKVAVELQTSGTEVIAVPCDASNESEMQHFIARVIELYGGVDVLFNVAGIIEVGPLDSMTKQDFEKSMQINCWAALHSILAVLPAMRKQRWGRIVNIASIGGKIAIPHMLPYAASKFALVGLSNGLRSELVHENIFVTTACPGMLQTGSPRNATFKGKHREEYAWFSVADSLPILSLDAEQAAAQILTACQQGVGEVVIAHPLNIPTKYHYLVPELTAELSAIANAFLPSMGGIGKSSAYGHESETPLTQSSLTASTQRAALQNNQY